MPRPSQLLLLLPALCATTHGFTPSTKSLHVIPSSIHLPSPTYARRQLDYDDDIEFFDLDDDEDDFDDDDDYSPSSYNDIIPNPLLDAMDPDGVYERLGPELFSDWTFWRDAALFCLFLAFFTKDTHHYGMFDSVIEGLEDLPENFVGDNIDKINLGIYKLPGV